MKHTILWILLAALVVLPACGPINVCDAQAAACVAQGGTWEPGPDCGTCTYPTPPPDPCDGVVCESPNERCVEGACVRDSNAPPDDRRVCNRPPENAKVECWNRPPGGEWEWIPKPVDPPPPPPTAKHCPIPEGVLVALPGYGAPEYHGEHLEVTRDLGPLPGLTPPQKLRRFAEAFTAHTGICAFAGIEAVFIKRSDDRWDEYHSVSFGDGGWTNSGRGKWVGAHDDVRRTPEGLRMPDPRDPPVKLAFNIHARGNDIDTTLTVKNALEYCQAIRMGKHGSLPRAGCPVRPEGHAERYALERAILGAQTHTCNGTPMPWKNGNPAVADGRCVGEYETCSEDGSICTRKVMQ